MLINLLGYLDPHETQVLRQILWVDLQVNQYFQHGAGRTLC